MNDLWIRADFNLVNLGALMIVCCPGHKKNSDGQDQWYVPLISKESKTIDYWCKNKEEANQRFADFETVLLNKNLAADYKKSL